MIDRVRLAGRRLTATPDGPLAATAVFALLAMVQVVAGGVGGRVSTEISDGRVITELLLALCATAPLALVTRNVLGAALTITFGVLLSLAADLTTTAAAVLALIIVDYRLARTRSRRVSFPILLPFVAYAVGHPEPPAILLLGVLFGTVALGTMLRERAEAKVRNGSSEAVAASLLEHAARGERARIARELHDVVAHHISLIAVQAETARLTTPGLPDEGARRLVAISDTARTALTEMRRLLGVLREDAGTAPTRAPQPGLVQLNELIDDARESSGASTRLIVRGRVGPLDPGVELTAYRIVQEALTNARRHAAGAAVDVELHYAENALRILVRDNGPGSTGGTGHGLLGMRERAGMVGGTLSAGPAPVSGFLVDVALPTTVDVQ